MATKGVSGPALAAVAGGAFLVYVGIKGTTPLEELRSILTGATPEPLGTSPKGTAITVTRTDEYTPGEGFAGGSDSSIVRAAAKYLGRPYRWGGTFAGGAGGDCSGLVYRALTDAGYTVRRLTTFGWMTSPMAVTVTKPEPGDLVVWPGHMGIYVGSGKMIVAPRTGTVVQYQTVGRRNGIAPTYRRVRKTGGPKPQ
jgi:cell wall-associated NlpC family hydrolase